jgi:hypothetical protein
MSKALTPATTATTAVIAHPVQVRPTPPEASYPDELLITWGATPGSGRAQLYLPAVDAADIMALAERHYNLVDIQQEDRHTVSCPTSGAVWIPLPPGTALSAGLLSIELPGGGPRRGSSYTVSVRQFTQASAATRRPPPPPPPPRIAGQRRASVAAVAPPDRFNWSHLLGAFQFVVNSKPKDEVLLNQERLLATLRWMLVHTPPIRRWHPVLVRYVDLLAGVVAALGGNPGSILPSPIGAVPGWPLHAPHHPPVGPVGPGEEGGDVFRGKIEGLVYDHFGDFVGFILETEDGAHHRFSSRESPMLEVVRRAWSERAPVTVEAERHDRHVPRTIVVRV